MEFTPIAEMSRTDRAWFVDVLPFPCGAAPLISRGGRSFYVAVSREGLEFGSEGDFIYAIDRPLSREGAGLLISAVVAALSGENTIGDVANAFGAKEI